jgi:leader peptidase (prepilin peptidase)/N-methyltransferase
VRWAGNAYYGRESMGLGDVKLMAAAGLWLGPHGVILALICGAVAGVMHGCGLALVKRLKTGLWPPMSQLELPAGPGFIVGMIGAWFYG